MSRNKNGPELFLSAIGNIPYKITEDDPNGNHFIWLFSKNVKMFFINHYTKINETDLSI